ncbi:uncharacterized protein LOC130647574 [Hydractinia symbiolongicarpus]|uniref:uncharacterized protein LOC130647574 n=1 Tax=Hydractinia symbiolongicarpus TaxID=13093 RepID=UPI00254BF54B|nr:uncharacterized protein LOC130647574 [Hydractinia symbiolongicarpus]
MVAKENSIDIEQSDLSDNVVQSENDDDASKVDGQTLNKKKNLKRGYVSARDAWNYARAQKRRYVPEKDCVPDEESSDEEDLDWYNAGNTFDENASFKNEGMMRKAEMAAERGFSVVKKQRKTQENFKKRFKKIKSSVTKLRLQRSVEKKEKKVKDLMKEFLGGIDVVEESHLWRAEKLCVQMS